MANTIMEKISRYNLFNYLLPGILFMAVVSRFYGLNLVSFFDQNIVVSLFVTYFIGMIISRFGSIFVEFILKKTGFVTFGSYGDFLEASKVDEKIETLVEENNVHRTIISLFVLLLFSYGAVTLLNYYHLDINWLYAVVFVFCFILFLFSYRKQSKYIKNRINNNLNSGYEKNSNI